jgi:hypothetical protein
VKPVARKSVLDLAQVGLHGGNYVPLTVPEFQYAYAEFRAVLNGDKLGRPDFCV